MIRINSLVGDRYKIVSELGHGGMSNVYEARDIILKRPVALKIIKFENAQKIENIIRFQNEARFSCAFNHPNIVKIYDYGEFENLPYIVNELMKGQTLRGVLDYKRNFSVNESCSIMLQICDAISCVHSKKIVHRDIKPLNIFYQNDGLIKLSDFGISILLDSSLNLNESRRVVGTIQYLSPELVMGGKASFQSDIYAMGITFYELLTGRVPFDDKDPKVVARMHVESKMPSPLQIIPTLPKETERIIFKATAKDPLYRYRSVEEMRKDILSLYKNKKVMKASGGLLSKIFGFSRY